MAEFCPICGTPLDTTGDDSRICEACGWFGEKSETSPKPPPCDTVNPVLATIQALTLYRDVCRSELICEQVYDAGDCTETEMKAIKLAARESMQSLVTMFTALRSQHAPPEIMQKALQLNKNGLLGYPQDWPSRYNACNEPCDMLIGPCACGAWHTEDEEWVQEALKIHHTIIIP
jgi:hypothetical protein